MGKERPWIVASILVAAAVAIVGPLLPPVMDEVRDVFWTRLIVFMGLLFVELMFLGGFGLVRGRPTIGKDGVSIPRSPSETENGPELTQARTEYEELAARTRGLRHQLDALEEQARNMAHRPPVDQLPSGQDDPDA